jgi:hypothetical protein
MTLVTVLLAALVLVATVLDYMRLEAKKESAPEGYTRLAETVRGARSIADHYDDHAK